MEVSQNGGNPKSPSVSELTWSNDLDDLGYPLTNRGRNSRAPPAPPWRVTPCEWPRRPETGGQLWSSWRPCATWQNALQMERQQTYGENYGNWSDIICIYIIHMYTQVYIYINTHISNFLIDMDYWWLLCWIVFTTKTQSIGKLCFYGVTVGYHTKG